jgi:hypothetical protein
MSERKHLDLWKELAEKAGEDEIDRAASVTVEEAEAELKAAGFDVAAERAKASAFLDRLAGDARRQGVAQARATPRVESEKPRARTRPAFGWLAAAAMVGLVAGGALVAAFQPEQNEAAHAPRSAENVATAIDLRRQARAACDQKQWTVCLAELDRARSADPDGDAAPAVTHLREEAIAKILEHPEPQPH